MDPLLHVCKGFCSICVWSLFYQSAIVFMSVVFRYVVCCARLCSSPLAFVIHVIAHYPLINSLYRFYAEERVQCCLEANSWHCGTLTGLFLFISFCCFLLVDCFDLQSKKVKVTIIFSGWFCYIRFSFCFTHFIMSVVL